MLVHLYCQIRQTIKKITFGSPCNTNDEKESKTPQIQMIEKPKPLINSEVFLLGI